MGFVNLAFALSAPKRPASGESIELATRTFACDALGDSDLTIVAENFVQKVVGVARFELATSCSQNKCSNLAELHPEWYYHGSQRPRRQSTGPAPVNRPGGRSVRRLRGSDDLADVLHLSIPQIVSQPIEHVQRRRRISERSGADLHRAGAGE